MCVSMEGDERKRAGTTREGVSFEFKFEFSKYFFFYFLFCSNAHVDVVVVVFESNLNEFIERNESSRLSIIFIDKKSCFFFYSTSNSCQKWIKLHKKTIPTLSQNATDTISFPLASINAPFYAAPGTT